ncbi:MAG: Uncharacterised protein [Porticoccaceae bacterium UBA1117]|nr:MAG: Uncharacterised protein [Porticoccaceae bacterium UBA1117]
MAVTSMIAKTGWPSTFGSNNAILEPDLNDGFSLTKLITGTGQNSPSLV